MNENGNGHKNVVFGDFRLQNGSQILLRNNSEVHLAKRPFQVLHFLIENRERVVSRDELLDLFWDGSDVYDDALRKCVGSIRKALEDDKKPPRFIETRYGSGYRFIGAVAGEEAARHNEAYNGNNGSKVRAGFVNTGHNVGSKLKNRKVFPSIVFIGLSFLIFTGAYVYFPRQGEAQPVNHVETSAAVRSIAVMPLKNLTGDEANEYFSDGITESIITELSRVDELAVTSRSSTFALKGEEIDPREIRKRLNVDAVLEGGVQKRGDMLSINLRLISTENGRVLWTSQNFDRSLANAYELQETIACNVAHEIRAEICNGDAKGGTRNSGAYQSYLKGRYHWNKRTGEGIRQSIDHYQQAIARDPNYALAYAGLAESYVQGIWHVPFAARDVLPKAKAAGLKALKLDNSLAEAHTALANVYELEWDWAGAERELNIAIELNPRYARAHHVRAFFLVIMERYDEALASIDRASELDPLNLVISTDKANLLFAAGRVDDAFQQWSQTLELDPNFAMAYEHRAIAYQIMHSEQAAIEQQTRAMELSGQRPERVAAYHRSALKRGLKEVYRDEVKKLLGKEKRGEHISFIGLAWYYTLLQKREEAFNYLEKAYRERSGEMVLLPSPHFAPLRSDPRFTHLQRRVGLIK
jgi:TolB-like protein/DNA-binding winged helix-turn-helix (wHTH) protein/Tfp pilus assembly protein PilF